MVYIVGVSRYYVMTDHSGSPVAMFDRSGGLVKRVDYTVFGQVTQDDNPALNVYLGFQVSYSVRSYIPLFYNTVFMYSFPLFGLRKI